MWRQYKSKHSRPTGSRKTMRRMLAVVPVMAAALICYSVNVYAWFQASIVNSGNVIQATNYSVEVQITGTDGNEIAAGASGYELQAGETYSVTLTAAGGGTKGYCMIQPGGTEPGYIVPVVPGSSLEFTLIPDQKQTYTFTAVWGEYTGSEDIIEADDVIGQKNALSDNSDKQPEVLESSPPIDKAPAPEESGKETETSSKTEEEQQPSENGEEQAAPPAVSDSTVSTGGESQRAGSDVQQSNSEPEAASSQITEPKDADGKETQNTGSMSE